MFVHLSESHFEIVVIKNQKLQFFNSFDYKTPEDFIYYILFTAEQLQLNPEVFKLEILGSCTENDSYYLIGYKYIRNVQLFDVSNAQNDFSAAENREHFILLHSWELFLANTKAVGSIRQKTFLFDQRPTWAKKPCSIF